MMHTLRAARLNSLRDDVERGDDGEEEGGYCSSMDESKVTRESVKI